MDEPIEELLTVAESAKALKVSPYTIYRWIAAGTLPAVRFSRKVIRIRRSDLGSLPSQHQQTPRAIGSGYQVVREVALAPYKAGTSQDEEKREVENLLAHYRELVNRPRSPDEPPKGSAEAVLRHVGVISKEEGEELRRLIMEDREASRYDPD
jgi:excisionase family DNA binding protein